MPLPNPILSGATVSPGGGPSLIVPASVADFDTKIINGIFAAAPTNYYPMNEPSGTTVVDAMGNANGTYNGSPFFQARQLIPDGKPVPFFKASSTQYATLNDPTTSATAFTYMFAFVNQGFGSSAVFSDYTGGGSYVINSVDASGNLSSQLNGGNTQSSCQMGTSVHLVFGVYDGTQMLWYLDGNLVQTITGAYTKQGSGWAIGAQANGTYPATGNFGKAGIWGSTALTQAQITNITNAFFGSTITAIASSSAPAVPFQIVQESIGYSGSAASSWTFNFKKAATAGNTLLVFQPQPKGYSATTPSGYSILTSYTSGGSYEEMIVYIKTAAGGETSVAINTGVSVYETFYMMEIAGSHSLDQSATASGTYSDPSTDFFPDFTPSLGSMVFVVACLCPGFSGAVSASPADANANWRWVTPITAAAGRALLLGIYQGPGTGASISGPAFSYPPYASGCQSAMISFSIL